MILLFLISTLWACENINYSCPDGGPYNLHLTFDDGPHDWNTGKILDILKDEGVQASFFLQILKLVDRNGERINYSGRREDLASKGIPNYYYFLLDRMKNEGHYIGTHTYEHWRHVNSYVAEDNWRENIDRGYPEVLEEYFSYQSQPLVRLPHGQGWFEQTSTNSEKRAIAEAIMKYIESKGMLHVGWNIDSNDWRYEDLNYRNLDNEIETFDSESEKKRHYLQGLVDQVCSRGGGIILLHSAYEINWSNLRCMIKGFKSVGHTFGSPEDFIGFERAWGAPLIGRKARCQEACNAYLDSTISPMDLEQMSNFSSFMEYIYSKYQD